jgi:hypothetical protein
MTQVFSGNPLPRFQGVYQLTVIPSEGRERLVRPNPKAYVQQAVQAFSFGVWQIAKPESAEMPPKPGMFAIGSQTR